MNEATRSLLAKAQRAIAAAETLLESRDTEFAAGRAYYAMFYIAEALLNERGLKYRKHGGVHAAVGEKLVKEGELDAKYHKWLLAAFDKRIVADYGIEAGIDEQEVRTMIVQARDFLRAAQAFLDQ